MISESDIERALDWLRNNAVSAARARANRAYLEEYRKSLKALLMSEHTDKPLGVQEREAYRDQRYTEHLQAMKSAVEEDERQRWLMVAAQAKIDAWRTQQANERIQVRV